MTTIVEDAQETEHARIVRCIRPKDGQALNCLDWMQKRRRLSSERMRACRLSILCFLLLVFHTSMSSACDAGYYGSSECTPCEAGQYSDSGATACTKCGKGKYWTVTGATRESVCEGLRTDGLCCDDCPDGKYADTKGSSTCKDCQAGQRSKKLENNVPRDCPEGKYEENN